MFNTDKGYVILLFLILCGSLFFKGIFGQAAYNDPPARGVHLSHSGLHLVQQFQPVNRGRFDIQLYRHEVCRGALAVMALNKNEEGAGVLAHFLKKSPDAIRYVYQNQIYNQFPAIKYGLASLWRLGPQSPVLAVADIGDCRLIDQIDWQAF